MKRVCIFLLIILILSFFLTGCSQEPWTDMVETLMRGDYEKANKQYAKIDKNYIHLIKTSEYVYQYIENIVTSFKKDFTTYQTVEKKLNLFSLLDMPLYNLESAKQEIERIQASRTSFEEGKKLYGEESYYPAYELFKQVEEDDTKYFNKAQEYLLSTVYVLLYTKRYDEAKDVIMAVQINVNTLPKLSEYSIDLIVYLLYYKDDLVSAQKLNDELIQTIILMDESIRDSLKSWATKFKSVYSKPEYSAVCISFLSSNIEDMFFKLEQTDMLIEDKKTDYAFTILQSIDLRQDTMGYIAPRMTKIISQYISQDKISYAQGVVDKIFSEIDNGEMVKSLVTYIQKNIERAEDLDNIDMTVGK